MNSSRSGAHAPDTRNPGRYIPGGEGFITFRGCTTTTGAAAAAAAARAWPLEVVAATEVATADHREVLRVDHTILTSKSIITGKAGRTVLVPVQVEAAAAVGATEPMTMFGESAH